MPHIHTAKYLPSRQAIQSVALYSEQFNQTELDFNRLVVDLKKTVLETNFMVEQDNSYWATAHGMDYFHNPKLFAQAPLTYVCAFISEMFKGYEIEEIKQRLPVAVLEQALIRLKSFCH